MRHAPAIAALVALAGSPAFGAPAAEDLYIQGQAAYDKGDFSIAVARWQESYKLSGASGLLFNIAQAYRQSGHCKEALYTYRRYVALDPKADQRGLADDFVRELASLCDVPAPLPRPPSPTAARREPGATERVAGVVVVGGGGALLVTGIAFGAHAQSLAADVTRACAGSGCDWGTVKATDDAGRRDAAIGRILDVVGVAGVVGGAALYYLGVRSEVVVAPIATARASGAVLSWRASW